MFAKLVLVGCVFASFGVCQKKNNITSLKRSLSKEERPDFPPKDLPIPSAVWIDLQRIPSQTQKLFHKIPPSDARTDLLKTPSGNLEVHQKSATNQNGGHRRGRHRSHSGQKGHGESHGKSHGQYENGYRQGNGNDDDKSTHGGKSHGQKGSQQKNQNSGNDKGEKTRSDNNSGQRVQDNYTNKGSKDAKKGIQLEADKGHSKRGSKSTRSETEFSDHQSYHDESREGDRRNKLKENLDHWRNQVGGDERRTGGYEHHSDRGRAGEYGSDRYGDTDGYHDDSYSRGGKFRGGGEGHKQGGGMRGSHYGDRGNGYVRTFKEVTVTN